MTTEIYKDIPGYEGLYQVSDRGNVMTVKTNRVLKPGVNHQGYHQVGLYKECVRKTFRVHRLVALAFLENQDLKEQVNHIDGVKSNNSISNLEWNTPKENTRHSRKVLGNTGMLGKLGVDCPNSKPVVQLTREGVQIKTYLSLTDAQREIGVNVGNICQACLGKLKSAGGYRWRYA